MSLGNDKTRLLVRSQLPDHIANDYGTFVEFIRAYYDFVKQNYDIKVESLRDVDTISNNLLLFLRRELLKGFPGSFIDERKLIRTIRNIYKRKGNVDSLKLLFKLFFNDSIVVKQPGEKILRASDGKWFQYYGITLSQLNWENITLDLLRAAVNIEPHKTLFETPVSETNSRYIGDIDNSGSITSADALLLKKFSLNPSSIDATQLEYIENIFIPFILNIQDGEVLSKYIYTQFNELDVVPGISRLVIENRFGRFTPLISFIEVEKNRSVRIFFKNYTNLRVVTGQEISITGNDGSTVFTGKLVPSYSTLNIINPGKNWQKGQVFNITGTEKDTIARVKEIDAQGGVSEVEILEYGYSHDNELAFYASPYPVKPSENSSYNLTSTPTSVDGSGNITSYLYTLSLRDITEGTKEELFLENSNIDFAVLSEQILSAAAGIEPALTLFNTVNSGYKIGDVNQTGVITTLDAKKVLDYSKDVTRVTTAERNHIETILIPTLISLVDTVEADPQNAPSYTGILYEIVNPFSAKTSLSTTDTTSIRYNYSELTFEEWVESQALFKFVKADIFKTKGYYLNDDSQISNLDSRLQDNYFYQIFSYLIETSKTGDEVEDLINQLHPAGMKYFIETAKTNYYSIVDLLESFRALSIDQVYLAEIALVSDILEKIFAKNLEETFDVSETEIKTFIKNSEDAIISNEEPIKFFTKNTQDSNLVSELPLKTFNKNSVESFVSSDLVQNKSIDKPVNEILAPVDTPAKTVNKYGNEDSFSADEGQFLSISAEGYGAEAESYSAELYSQIAYEAYIG